MKYSEFSQDPQMFTAALPRWGLVFLGLTLAVLMGFWIGDSQWNFLLYCMIITVVGVVAFGVREKAWLLIVMGWSLTGSILYLRLPFSIRDITVMLAACAYVGYRVVTRRSISQPWRAVDIILAVNLLYLAFTFFYNPVGFWAFRSEKIGARPYVNIFLATVAGWVIARMPENEKTVSRLPWFLLVGAGLLAALNVMVYVAPSSAGALFPFYSELDTEGRADMLYNSAEPSYLRFKGLSAFGLTLVLALCAHYPLRELLNFLRWRSYLFLLGIGSILATGFRSLFLWVLVATGLGTLFRRGWHELTLTAGIGVLLVAGLAVGQGRFFELPEVVQRTLSYLPAKWSPIVVAEAEVSTRARFEWWRRIINERAIKDWWFGDGFGTETKEMLSFYSSFNRNTEEAVFLTGSFHSGPFTTIRSVGIVGLTLICGLMLAAAVDSVRCFQRCRGTALEPAAIFVAIQLLWTPIHFTFVFGAYNVDMPQLIFLIGLLKLLMRMAEESRSVVATAPAAVPAFRISAPAFRTTR